MNSTMHMNLDDCDLAYMVLMIVPVWRVLLWLCEMYEHGPDTRWLLWYDMMYTLYDMNYITDRLHRYSMDYMIAEDEQIWNDLSEWLEYMNVLWCLTWIIRMHVFVVYS